MIIYICNEFVTALERWYVGANGTDHEDERAAEEQHEADKTKGATGIEPKCIDTL